MNEFKQKVLYNFEIELNNTEQGIYEEGKQHFENLHLSKERFPFYRYLHQAQDIFIQYNDINKHFKLNIDNELENIYQKKMKILIEIIYKFFSEVEI